MSIKTILAGLSGGSASDGVIEVACRLAEQFEAHLEGLHVRIDAGEFVIAAGAEGLAASASMALADQLAATAAEKAKKLQEAFTAAASRHGLAVRGEAAASPLGLTWRVEAGDAPAVIASRARFFDLAVLGRSDRVINEPHTDAIEETLLFSGRPVLLAPAEPPASIGQTIAVGWNGSAQAVRSLTASLPFLCRARDVVLLEAGASAEAGVTDIQAYLRVYGVEAKIRSLRGVRGSDIGAELLSAAQGEGADLMVLGGYGHSPLRESLFGGATRQILGMSHLPLLIAH